MAILQIQIDVNKLPQKRSYVQYQEDLEIEDGSITAIYNDDTSLDVAPTDDEVELLDFDNTILGRQQIIVMYKGFETSFPVTIYETEEEADEYGDFDGKIINVEVIKGIEKTEYIKGVDSFDITGIVLRITYESGEYNDVILSEYPKLYTISGYDNTKVGVQNVTLNCLGYNFQFKVNVVSRDSIVLVSDTLAKKTILIILFGIICITSGAIILYKNTKKEVNN